MKPSELKAKLLREMYLKSIKQLIGSDGAFGPITGEALHEHNRVTRATCK